MVLFFFFKIFKNKKIKKDLKTMEERLQNKYYKTLSLFVDDMMKVFNNCRAYNGVGTVYYKCADQLEPYFKDQVQKLAKLLEEKGIE